MQQKPETTTVEQSSADLHQMQLSNLQSKISNDKKLSKLIGEISFDSNDLVMNVKSRGLMADFNAETLGEKLIKCGFDASKVSAPTRLDDVLNDNGYTHQRQIVIKDFSSHTAKIEKKWWELSSTYQKRQEEGNFGCLKKAIEDTKWHNTGRNFGIGLACAFALPLVACAALPGKGR